MQHQDSSRRRAPRKMHGRATLRAVPAQPREQDEQRECHKPAGYTPGERIAAVEAADDRLSRAGILQGDDVVTSLDRPPQNYDLAVVVTTDNRCRLGRFHRGPGGYVRLESLDGEGVVDIFRPSEIQDVGRALHVERAGQVVKRF